MLAHILSALTELTPLGEPKCSSSSILLIVSGVFSGKYETEFLRRPIALYIRSV